MADGGSETGREECDHPQDVDAVQPIVVDQEELEEELADTELAKELQSDVYFPLKRKVSKTVTTVTTVQARATQSSVATGASTAETTHTKTTIKEFFSPTAKRRAAATAAPTSAPPPQASPAAGAGSRAGKRPAPTSAPPRTHHPTGFQAATKRCVEHPGQHLEPCYVSLPRAHGKRWVVQCKVCRTQLQSDKNTVDFHVQSPKHTSSVKEQVRTGKVQVTLQTSLETGTTSNNPARDAFRVDTVRTLAKTGIPLYRLRFHDFRQLIENGSDHSLGNFTDLYDLVPTVLDLESKLVKQELGSSDSGLVSLFYDGATKIAECYIVVGRFVNEAAWTINERVISLQLLKRSLNAQELAGVVSTAVALYGLQDRVALVQRDGAQVNAAAFRRLHLQARPDVVDVKAVDGACLSHGLNLVGELMDTKTQHLSEFWSKLQVFTKSGKGKSLFKATFGRAPPTHSKTRWWSTLDALLVIEQIGVIERLLPLLTTAKKEKIATAATNKLIELLSAPASLVKEHASLTGAQQLQVQLAAYLDFGTSLRNATYFLEGNGFLAPLVSSRLEELGNELAIFAGGRHPRLTNVAGHIVAAGPDAGEAAKGLVLEEIVDYGRRMMGAPHAKFTELATSVGRGKRYAPLVRGTYPLFRALDPLYAGQAGVDTLVELVHRMSGWSEMIDDTPVRRVGVPTMTESWQNALIEEISAYKAAVRGYEVAGDKDGQGAAAGGGDDREPGGMRATNDPADGDAPPTSSARAKQAWGWWGGVRKLLPAWCRLAAVAALMQPSSATVERAFSSMQWMLNTGLQASAKTEYAETAVMVRFNDNNRESNGCGGSG